LSPLPGVGDFVDFVDIATTQDLFLSPGSRLSVSNLNPPFYCKLLNFARTRLDQSEQALTRAGAPLNRCGNTGKVPVRRLSH
jgi:hypothetical protein